MKTIIKLFVALFIIGALIYGAIEGGLLWLQYEQGAFEELRTDRDIEVSVTSGETAYSLIGEVYHPEINRYIIKYWLKNHPELTGIKKGSYLIPAGSTPTEVLSMICSGKEQRFSITLVEGNTVDLFLANITNNSQLKHVLPEKFGYAELVKLLGTEHSSPEGLLLPETYVFVKGDSDESIIKRAYSDMKSYLHTEYETRGANLPYTGEYDALIMASIIEKETSVADERPLIASVFVNRLKKGMKLQTDPTVIYGVRDRYKGKILQSHLSDKNAYNTYVITGLPPTPIAAPSKASIHAALHPADTDYLFFVAKGPDPKFGHIFSSTDRQHAAAVKNYRKAVSDYKRQAVSDDVSLKTEKDNKSDAGTGNHVVNANDDVTEPDNSTDLHSADSSDKKSLHNALPVENSESRDKPPVSAENR